jgi:large subunit ribosomal protein L32
MAVPKRKTSKSKRNMRRSHHAPLLVNVVIDPQTGEYKLPHHISSVDGTYKGRKVLVENQAAQDEKGAVEEKAAATL